MKINSLGFGTIVFSIGIFFFNLTSGQGLPSSNKAFLTILFEDVSIFISIVTVYFVFKNKFEDSDNYLNWFVILNVLAAFSALFISSFYETNSSSTISLNNYLILLSYLMFLILVLLTLFVHKQKQLEASKKKKVIKLTQEKSQ